MKVKLNKELGGFKVGQILEGEVLNSLYWRGRIKDSEIDSCLEVINEYKKVDEVEDRKNKKVKIGG